MIIHSLKAANLLKYVRLELNDIPEKGLIAVSGPNESGKTAVVETLCFALFGRTYARGPNELGKIIRWGEAEASVEMYFTARNSKRYGIARTLQQNGTQAAELTVSGEDRPECSGPNAVNQRILELCGFDFDQYLDALYLAQREISEPHSQSHTIKAIAGAGELETVLLQLHSDRDTEQAALCAIDAEIAELQRQIEALGDPQVETEQLQAQHVALEKDSLEHQKNIVDIDQQLEKVLASCEAVQQSGRAYTEAGVETSLTGWRELGVELADQVAALQGNCSAIAPDATSIDCNEPDLRRFADELNERLQAFEPVREHIQMHQEQLDVLLGKREPGDDDEIDELPIPKRKAELRTQLARGRSARFTVFLALLAFLGTAGAALSTWWSLVRDTDWQPFGIDIGAQLATFPWWRSEYAERLLPVAAVCAVLALVLFPLFRKLGTRTRGFRRQIRKMDEQMQAKAESRVLLEQLDSLPFPEAVQRLRRLGDAHINRALRKFVDDPGAGISTEAELRRHQGELRDLLERCASNTAKLRSLVAAQRGKLERRIEEAHEAAEKLTSIQQEVKRRSDQAQTLQAQIDAKSQGKAGHEQQSLILDEAIRLTDATCKRIYGRFNQLLSQYTAEVLPKLTEGRYGRMKIGDDFRVGVFSMEKNDFASLDELSSGAQRQVLLATRLAMSKALTEVSNQQHQFLILDEPFAFFDRERIRNTLKALSEMDKTLSQIWIISQEFEFRGQFKWRLECSRDSSELLVSGNADNH